MKFLNKILGRGSENKTQEVPVENPEVIDAPEDSSEPVDPVEAESPAAAESAVEEHSPAAEEPDSLTQARACREAGQLRDSVGHYQQYLRGFIEAPILEELAEVFEELGEAYMASSSRMIADSLKNKV